MRPAPHGLRRADVLPGSRPQWAARESLHELGSSVPGAKSSWGEGF